MGDTALSRSSAELLAAEFADHSDLFRAHAAEQPDKVAIADEEGRISWGELDALVDRIAARLQAEGVGRGGAVAIVGSNSIAYAAVFLAAVRTGAAAAPLTTSATPEALTAMLADSRAKHLFADPGIELAVPPGVERISLHDLDAWLPPESARPQPVTVAPEDPFNIIYSSGTTGTPKGIVQSHRMRWNYLARTAVYGPESVALLSTPLYSNTTLVSFLPCLGAGGTAVLMKKFEARRFLELSERHRVTHTMLVPVQYRRIMALPDFESFDLSSYRAKFCTSAPFAAELKRDILDRWPGGLVEFYGMTEGGASCVLVAHEHPDKLHTVGQVAPNSEMKLIDEDGNEVAPGGVGEVVGRGPMMMNGYNGRPEATRAAEWFDAGGRRFIRHGDVGRFDEDGFLILMDRTKDMIISGGFNIFPSDLEAVLAADPGVIEAAVVGVPHPDWGETPVGFVVLRPGADRRDVLTAANGKLGRMQRLSALHVMDQLPRSPIGKVLKRELRDRIS
ncbi:putative fatty acid--CoA ligase [Sphingomonas changbaiensis NBRC 104936]|uniref:Putative fatty acid--CoA ligase n=1 Tax=Sphingomonas changbaiensis NBRC 104936 TaxID=1219043 RepID=A0A0E9MRB8_9SPHN|nr:class I adenylate-forming enzyme family protein [Sphingomonas changbaiensis]GAO40018.1 putative fatty acid--CoA ligase [Sphingomonas changbaiensis NBRC 104936]